MVGKKHYTHAWGPCLMCQYKSGDKGCETDICCLCCRMGDFKANTTYRGKRTTDINGCGCCSELPCPKGLEFRCCGCTPDPNAAGKGCVCCCGLHRYDISGAPATNGTNTNAATTTSAPQAQQMSHDQGAAMAQMGGGGAPAPAQVAHGTQNTGAGTGQYTYPTSAT
ncbi:hypothetical protein WJX73_007170 [Symbiochloris irregularis]|uniref:Uncharacterized protein n=1 Tax=Symbiochloris irregularis TaxID=706552 RepID=A0AAW1P868_9CHLO